MKKSVIFLYLLLCPTIVWAENVYVMVRETQLRAKPEFLSQGTLLKYGDSLFVVNDNQNWLNVKTSYGKQGFVHRSAITATRIVLKGQSSFVPAGGSQNEVVLAGKGFNSDVENQFASQNPALNFREVDAMERPRVAPKDLGTFVKEGKLSGGAL